MATLPLPEHEPEVDAEYQEALDAIERASMYFEETITWTRAFLKEQSPSKAHSHRAKASNSFRMFIVSLREIPDSYNFPHYGL